MVDQIGKYRIEGVLGHGAMGVVYRGLDATLDRPVAIKTIHAHLLTGPVGAELLKRFKTEATAAARCQHANIVTVYEFGQHEDTPYIAMEFVKGTSLDQIMKDQRALPMKRINAFFLGIARGLNYAHQAGIVHRDVKPANIMVLAGDAIKLADFGIAKMPTSEMTQVGLTLGTPSYMAPEQRTGAEIDARVDVFALGVVMFELLAASSDLPKGSQPVKAVALLPPSPKLSATQTFPASIAAFLEQALSPDPAKRFGNIAKMLDAYKAALQNLSGTAPATKAPPPPTGAIYKNTETTQFNSKGSDDESRLYSRPDAEAEAKAEEEAGLSEEDRFIRKSLVALAATRALKAVDPILNPDWQQRITEALDQFDLKARERAYTSIIEPKNI